MNKKRFLIFLLFLLGITEGIYLIGRLTFVIIPQIVGSILGREPAIWLNLWVIGFISLVSLFTIVIWFVGAASIFGVWDNEGK